MDKQVISGEIQKHFQITGNEFIASCTFHSQLESESKLHCALEDVRHIGNWLSSVYQSLGTPKSEETTV